MKTIQITYVKTIECEPCDAQRIAELHRPKDGAVESMMILDSDGDPLCSLKIHLEAKQTTYEIHDLFKELGDIFNPSN